VQLVLVRHGEPEWSVDGQSVDDPRLTERGRSQAARVAERLADEAFDQVLVSPLRRARETVEPIAERLGVDATVLPFLAEIGNPAWEGTPVENVERMFADQRLRPVEELWDGLPGGETFHAFHDRVSLGLDGHLRASGVVVANEHPRVYRIEPPDQRVLIVAHGGTNAVTVGSLLGIPPVPWEWERFVTYHASVTIIESAEMGGAHAFTLRRLSDLGHLPDEMHTV
jgi:broad specificity phosphatase PhoE